MSSLTSLLHISTATDTSPQCFSELDFHRFYVIIWLTSGLSIRLNSERAAIGSSLVHRYSKQVEHLLSMHAVLGSIRNMYTITQKVIGPVSPSYEIVIHTQAGWPHVLRWSTPSAGY
jgi:hypothetical protein